MSGFQRWCRFNLVGALGFVVQLCCVKLLVSLLPGRSSLCCCLAVELTLLHNFFWHVRFTWRDCLYEAKLLHWFIRFHGSNGLISLCGSAFLTRILILRAHAPVLWASALAVLCCCLVNFCIGQVWVFTPRPDGQQAARQLTGDQRFSNTSM